MNDSASNVVRMADTQQLRILCATDLSPESDMAMQRAVLLMQQLHADMLLLHVVDEDNARFMSRRRAALARSVLEAHLEILARVGCHPEISVRSGTPHQAIAHAARNWGADLIVLGAYRKRFADSLFGTTAERVMRAARIPVLNVNREPAGPYVEALLATDRSEAFVAVARMARELKLLEGARTSIVHALPSASRAMLYSAGITEGELGQYLRHMQQTSTDDLAADLVMAGLEPPQGVVIQQESDALPAIERAVGVTEADLLVIGASRHPAIKRVLRGSVSNEVLRRVRCDILVVSPAAVMHAKARRDLSYVGF